MAMTSPLLRQARTRIARWRGWPSARAAGRGLAVRRRDAAGVADIDIDRVSGAATIVLTGDLDVTLVPALAEHLRRFIGSDTQRVIFDMTQVGFADCAAARLICGQDPSLPLGVQPVVRCPPRLFRTLLALTGLAASCQVES